MDNLDPLDKLVVAVEMDNLVKLCDFVIAMKVSLCNITHAGSPGETGPQGQIGNQGTQGERGTRGAPGGRGRIGLRGTGGAPGNQGGIVSATIMLHTLKNVCTRTTIIMVLHFWYPGSSRCNGSTRIQWYSR